jgi:hypothetical protein
VSILLWKVWGLGRNLKHEQKCDDKRYVGTSERGPYENSCGDGRVPLDGSTSNAQMDGVYPDSFQLSDGAGVEQATLDTVYGVLGD